MPLDSIRLDHIQAACIVGILPAERLSPQALQVAIELSLDLTLAAMSGQLAHTVDYARTCREIEFILEAGCFRLLETAALALCHYLLTPPPEQDVTIINAVVTLTKPEALAGKGIPAVTLSRRIEQVAAAEEVLEAGKLLRIFETPEVGLFRLHGWDLGRTVPNSFGFKNSQDLLLEGGSLLRLMSQ